MTALREMIRARRVSFGYSLGDLARATGLSKQHLHHLEHGVTDNPTVSTLVAIGAALGVSAHVLFRAAVNDHDKAPDADEPDFKLHAHDHL